ncbi:MAG TPA: ribulose-phosphate 3-epimerase [Candidatus Bariatricus faecipullorum]|nr:ribulose-phosphate 3-epimerase [Candidatus Bariatricus faecipullorum]
MEYILSPSILSADFTRLGEQIKDTEENGAAWLHFDVMDGLFVPSISFGMPVLASIRKGTGQVMDTHLMITEPARYVEAFAQAGADFLTVHYEACQETSPLETLNRIHEYGMRAGIAIRPQTPETVLEPLLDKAEMFLVMTVNPGFGGQKLIPETVDKVRRTRQMLKEAGMPDKYIQVDGGVYLTNVEEVLDAGANVIVAGSAAFKGDAAENTKKFMEILKRYE